MDGFWYLLQMGCDVSEEFDVVYILGVIWFDIDEISDLVFGLLYILLQLYVFVLKMCKFGIGDGQIIVVYDGIGLFFVLWVWWMFKVMGV